MTTLFRFATFAILFIVLLPSMAQEVPVKVRLRINHDGRAKSVPPHIIISFDDRSARVPVLNDSFEVPPEFLHAKKITFAVVLGGEHLRISNLSGPELKYENWTLLLADHNYGEEYRSAVPKGADIRSSCILVLDSVNSDPGVVVFQSRCRRSR